MHTSVVNSKRTILNTKNERNSAEFMREADSNESIFIGQ